MHYLKRRFRAMKKYLFLSCALMLLGTSSVIEARHQQCAQRSLKIVGAVIAYSQLAALSNITGAPQQQILLVRSDKALSGQQYLKVMYNHGPNEPLPDEIFSGKGKWRFNLTRDCGCDGSLTENQPKDEKDIALATWIQTNDGQDIPRNLSPLCYVLRPKGLKPAPLNSRRP
jgi:hypothetical protein